MVLVLVIGDLYVPHRKPWLPTEFSKLLVPGKINHIFCTGNLCIKEVEEYFHSLSDQVHIVQGELDEATFPERLIVQIESLTFGLCHGHQILPVGDRIALDALRRDMGADVLLAGCSRSVGYEYDPAGGLILHPGSATGAPDVVDLEEPEPSFLLIDVQGNKMVAFSYCLRQGEVKVKKVVFDSVS